VASLFFTFGILPLFDKSDNSENKEEFYFTFLIILCVWAKIYLWNTSLAKAGTIFNFLFICEVLLLLAAGLMIFVVAIFLQ